VGHEKARTVERPAPDGKCPAAGSQIPQVSGINVTIPTTFFLFKGRRMAKRLKIPTVKAGFIITEPNNTSPLPKMKSLKLIGCFLVCSASLTSALNIVWVSDQLVQSAATDGSDNNATPNGVFGSGAGPYADEGFITLLTGAGHTVTRFNPADSPNPLGASDVATLNASDLVIIGRGIGSGSFDDPAETLQWNTSITKPILATNSYMTRASRLGWFTGSTQPDVISNVLTFTNLADPVQAFLTAGISMSGLTTSNSVSEAVVYPNAEVDIRGTSLISNPVVAGGTAIASTNAGASTWIAVIPGGTVLAPGSGPGNGQTLGGFRMQFLAGNREAAAGVNGGVRNAGWENLTADGEAMFLRAVTLAANNGVIPEPATATLAGLAGLMLLRRRRA
jgi:hypothetical protein